MHPVVNTPMNHQGVVVGVSSGGSHRPIRSGFSTRSVRRSVAACQPIGTCAHPPELDQELHRARDGSPYPSCTAGVRPIN